MSAKTIYCIKNIHSVMALSSLVDGDEGCTGPSGKLFALWKSRNNFATHAWPTFHTCLTVLLGQSGGLSPSAKEFHGKVNITIGKYCKLKLICKLVRDSTALPRTNYQYTAYLQLWLI